MLEVQTWSLATCDLSASDSLGVDGSTLRWKLHAESRKMKAMLLAACANGLAANSDNYPASESGRTLLYVHTVKCQRAGKHS